MKVDSMKKLITIIDPPNGWKYGFPKILPEDVKNREKWLVDNGYPQEEMDALGEYFWCRYWNAEDTND